MNFEKQREALRRLRTSPGIPKRQARGDKVANEINAAATGHLPAFITAPGQTDTLMVVAVATLLLGVMVVGNLYLRLHALPERMAHRVNHVQLEIIAVLTLLALFTHNSLFWIAALLIAMVRLPDYLTPILSGARSLAKLAGRDDPLIEPEPVPEDPPKEAPRSEAPSPGAASQPGA